MPYLFTYFMAGYIAANVAYHARREAGQDSRHALGQSLVTFFFPLALFQDLEHARTWKRLFPEDSK